MLAFNQMIGNQATMPNLKQLFRLLSRFMHEPDRLASLRSRMLLLAVCRRRQLSSLMPRTPSSAR